MSDRSNWDSRYLTPDLLHSAEPSDYLRANELMLPPSGLALDLAAGEGRNAVFLATRGLEVIALDISIRALEKCLRLAEAKGVAVHRAVVDLTAYQFPAERFDVIVSFNYLQRNLAPRIITALKPGGLLIFETLTVDHLKSKPDFNPDFLLRRGELWAMFTPLRPIKYREVTVPTARASRSVASLIAIKS
jgi:tellurite methyltransferase